MTSISSQEREFGVNKIGSQRPRENIIEQLNKENEIFD